MAIAGGEQMIVARIILGILVLYVIADVVITCVKAIRGGK
jgi:hypothetical protein